MNFLSKFKKGLSLALLAVFSVAPAMVSADYTDQAEIPSWALEAVEELAAINVMTGNGDGSFAPMAILNRAEVSKIIVLAADVAIDTTDDGGFSDVSEDAWYYDYVSTMYAYGWIDGYSDGTFGPGLTINRAEMAKMIVNAFEIDAVDNGPSFSDVTADAWFYPYVETVKANGIMLGYADGTFDPAGDVTRAVAAKIVYEGLLVATEVTGPAAGTLEVSLSSDTPRGTNIPYNATSVPFTTLELSAADDSDIEISSITFTRLGLGDNDDFDSVWLEIDGFKVGNDRSVNNDDIVELRFNPPIVVPAGQTLVADLVASTKYSLANDGTCFDTGAEGCNIGHHNRFAVVSADDIVSTAANVVGAFPIEGEEMEVANYQVSQLVMSTLGSATTVNVGDSFVELGKFRMLNASTTNKDIELRAITFKNQGTAELANVLENLDLYVSGELVSAETIIDGDYATFRLDNGITGGYVIEDGDSRIFSLRSDVVSAEANDDIKFKVDNFEDIVGIEIGTAFGVKTVDTAGNNAEDANATLQTYTIDSGDINVSRDPNSLGNQEYAPGSNDVVAMTARIVVSQPILVDGVTLKVDSYSTANNTLTELNEYFDNFRLYLNGDLIDSENSISGTTAAPVLNYSSQFEITGASVMKLVLNVQDAAATGSFIKFSLFATDFDSPEYISSGDTVVSTDLLGSALASKVEVEESVLTITRTDGYTTETVVAGVQDATFMKFVMDNNDSGDVNVTSITIKGLGTGVAATNYSNFTASLFVDGQKIGSSKTLDSATGTAAFNDIAVTIPSAGQEEFTVVMDTIEAVATGVIISTTTIDDLGVTTTVNDTEVGITTAVNPGDVLIDVAALPAGLVVGDKVAIGPLDATPKVDLADPTTELATVVAINGTTQIILSAGVVNLHTTADSVDKVSSVNYPANTASIEVTSVTGFSIGDIVVINNTDECDITGVTPATTLTLGTCDTTIDGTITGGNAGLITATPVGVPVKKPAVDTIRMAVTAADVDNAENGSGVKVYEGGVTDQLGAFAETAGASFLTGACDNATTTSNYLCGALFTFTNSGTLSVAETLSYSSDILISGATNVEIWKLRLSANDDDVQVKDLYLTSTIAPATQFDARADFMLYNEAGQLLGTEQMIGGKIHFELNSNKIIVPKDGNTTVIVKINVRDITDVNQTAKRIQLILDEEVGYSSGMQALTGATGSDIAQGNMENDTDALNLTTSAAGVAFVAYNTSMELDRVTTSSTVLTVGTHQELFRFKVTPDVAGDIYLGRIALDMSTSANVALANLVVEDASDAAKTYVVDANSQAAAAANTIHVVEFNKLLIDTSKEYVVYGDVTGAIVSGNSVSTKLGRADNATYVAPFTAPANFTIATTALGGGMDTIWSDDSNSAGDNDYLGGYLLHPDTTATTISMP